VSNPAADAVLIPPEAGLRPEYLTGEPADAAQVLGPHAEGRAVWEASHARFALREAIRLLGLRSDDEVLMPAFCCNTVSDPITAAGAAPVLCRVTRDARLDFDDVAERAKSSRARALIAVHYLGFPEDLEAAQRVCREHDLVLIEDCSHALFSAPGGVPVGRTADLAAFSIRKTLPLGIAGALTLNPDRYACPPPAAPEPAEGSPREDFLRQIKVLYTDFDRAVRTGESELGQPERNRLWAQARALYASDTEAHTISRVARVVMGHADREAIVARRRANFAHLLEHLGDWALFTSLPDGVCPLGFPVLVADREAAKKGLDEAAIGYLLHWSRKLVPAGGTEVCPEVPFLADHVMTLPIHQDCTEAHLDYLVACFTGLGIPPAVPTGD